MGTMRGLINKTILVTGAGKGIGKNLVENLVKKGSNVIAVSRTLEDLDVLRINFNCKTIQADLSTIEDCEKVVSEVGFVDGLVNNAGVAILEPFLETKVDNYEKIMRINV